MTNDMKQLRELVDVIVAEAEAKEPSVDIKEVVDRIVADGKLTAEEHKLLYEALWADGRLDKAELAQVRRISDLLADGDLEKVDE